MSSITYQTQKLANGVELFYKETGPVDAPTLLLLHGFPSSSRQYDALIPLLNQKFHIIAPDLPFYGLTKVPKTVEPTFANIAHSIELLLDHLEISKFSVYIFDYGAPTGLRLMLNPKYEITSIISSNGNAYEDGIKDFWDPLRIIWPLAEKKSLTKEEEKTFSETKKALSGLVTEYESYHGQYYNGEADTSRVNPENAIIDWKLLNNLPNSVENQLSLFVDYRNNLKMYPDFQEYFRSTNIPILAIWGINDPIFPKEGQVAFKRDSKNVKLVELEGGHFAGVSHAPEVAENILEFFSVYNLA